MLAAPPSTHDALTRTLLGGDDASVALVENGRQITFAELRGLVAARAEELALPGRSMVVLGGDPSIEYVVTYLAVLATGHVPLLAGDHAERLAAAWRPAATVDVRAGRVDIERTAHATPDLHPDLALLLSTSGSTGSPKLVRLSHANVIGNARAIAEYLELTSRDRAITSLPLHYSYGLSVLHSHLLVGAGVVVTGASVVDPCFRAALVEHGVTNIAGVPHTFALAERAGPDRLAVPSLRFLTVAGGRMPPDAVTRWAERSERWGTDFYVMYGQTEATARIAYLPPPLARTHPGSIGRAIPGGELRVDAPAGEPGELVYRGPNVMLGYATRPTDLALGATLAELRTGDIARCDPATGLFEIVGRRSRLVKPFGLRIDLDALEGAASRKLALAEVAITGDDEVLAVAAPGASGPTVRDWVARRTGLPSGLVSVETTRPLPRTASGKIDHAAVLAAARRPTEPATGPPDGSVAGVFTTVLGRDAGAADTFVSLGGDSLAYVECSVRLERVLGTLPPDWHLRPVEELERFRTGPAPDRPWWRRTARLDSTVLLRAIGTCTIVATHMRVTHYPGGAHLLLAVVGYNVSRFVAPIDGTRRLVRAGLRTVGRTAGPVVAWIAAGMVLFGSYSTGTLLLVNNYVGPPDHRDDHWHFWFIEVFVHLVLIVTALLAVPAIRRLDRRWPYGFALGLLAVALVFRYELIELLQPGQLRFRTHGGAFFFALGWLVHRSRTRWQRIVTSAACAITISGFFGWPQRELFIITCLVALVWFRQITVPRTAVAPIALVSAASLWILITHFTVWPPLTDALGRSIAYPVTIAVGVLAGAASRAAAIAVRRARSGGSEVVPRRPPIVRIA